jgi:hypothetical protein
VDQEGEPTKGRLGLPAGSQAGSKVSKLLAYEKSPLLYGFSCLPGWFSMLCFFGIFSLFPRKSVKIGGKVAKRQEISRKI